MLHIGSRCSPSMSSVGTCHFSHVILLRRFVEVLVPPHIAKVMLRRAFRPASAVLWLQRLLVEPFSLERRLLFFECICFSSAVAYLLRMQIFCLSFKHSRRLFGSRCTTISSLVLIMAAMAAAITTSPYVLSPYNLTAFLKWAVTASEAELDSIMPEIYLIEHRWHIAGDSDSEMEPPPAPIINREDLQRVWELRQVPCKDLYCRRCRSGRGGYKFPWIGPWTCPATVGDETTPPEELYRRVSQCRCGLH